ncbi:MAG: calcium-binding protein, partial [Steroidobacteraceae bacterium]
TIRFDDGTTWNLNTIKTMVQQGTSGADSLYAYAPGDSLSGLAGNDNLYGAAGNDLLSGGDGNDNLQGAAGADVLDGGTGSDQLQGQDGNDTLTGGEGNDYLYGGNGNDVLDGGAGNDYLTGDAGSDTYLFGRGDGQDTISNYDVSAGRTDTLQLKAGVAASDVQLTRSGTDLVVKIAGTTDQVTVSSFFYNNAAGGYALNAIRFDDGTSWDLNTINTKVSGGGSGSAAAATVSDSVLAADIDLLFARTASAQSATDHSMAHILGGVLAGQETPLNGGMAIKQPVEDDLSHTPIHTLSLAADLTSPTWASSNTLAEQYLNTRHANHLSVDLAQHGQWHGVPYATPVGLVEGALPTVNSGTSIQDSDLSRLHERAARTG